MEQYECTNCYHRGGLSQHGYCERCGSDAVISIHHITSIETIELLDDIFTRDELKVLFGIIVGDCVGDA